MKKMTSRRPVPRSTATLSYKQVVQKILTDPDFAREVQKKVKKAQQGDDDARTEVGQYFQATPHELKKLGLSPDYVIWCGATTPTTCFMLEFAAYASESD